MNYNTHLEDNTSSAQPPAQAVAETLRRPILDTSLLSIDEVVAHEAENNSAILAYAIHGDELLFMVFCGAEQALQSTVTKLNDNKQIHLAGRSLNVIVKASQGVVRQTSMAQRQRVMFATIFSPRLAAIHDGDKFTYVLGTPNEKNPVESTATRDRIAARLSKFMPVGTIPAWYPTIVKLGYERMLNSGDTDPLIHHIRCANCSVWSLSADATAWQSVVSSAVASGKLLFPSR